LEDPLIEQLRDYRRRLTDEYEAMARRDTELHAAMSDAKRKIDHATELIRAEGGPDDIEEDKSATSAPLRLMSARAGDALADAAAEVLRDTRQPMHFSAITRALVDRGVPIGGRNPSNNVIAAMTRDARFYRPRRGTYFLRELAKGPIRHVGVRHKRGA
jgi:hypothetical protein